MRVVLDTNTLVSAVISPNGPPRRLLDGARTQVFELCTSAALLAELLDVLSRDKFAARLTQAGITPRSIVGEVRRISILAVPQSVPRIIPNDPDDDQVLAAASAARVDLIVSGDRHLLGLGGHHNGIPIVTPAEAIARIVG